MGVILLLLVLAILLSAAGVAWVRFGPARNRSGRDVPATADYMRGRDQRQNTASRDSFGNNSGKSPTRDQYACCRAAQRARVAAAGHGVDQP